MAHRDRHLSGNTARKDVSPKSFDTSTRAAGSDGLSKATPGVRTRKLNPGKTQVRELQPADGSGNEPVLSGDQVGAHIGYGSWLQSYTYQRKQGTQPAADVRHDTGDDAGTEAVNGDTAGDDNISADSSGRTGLASGNFDAHLGTPVDPRQSLPKGYVRPDARLYEAICERLIDNRELLVNDVSVIVADGNVRLEGSVPDRRTRFAIEDIVEDTPGVREVDNCIAVRAGRGVQ
ncbi:MAG: hypothetical protein JWL63_3338 [Rhodocyclales bacterium]|nr:hypothetical protein [Rhodocyclales bacterium]